MNFFHLIRSLNNLTDESSNDDTNSLNVNNKYRDPEYFCNIPDNINQKVSQYSITMFVLFQKILTNSMHF